MAVALLGRLLCVAVLVSSSSAQVPANVAVGKTASQSSTFDGADGSLRYRASADLAVDGAPTKNYNNKTCAVTDWLNAGSCTNNPWWHLDLGGLYDVFNVTIYQRGEGANNRGPLVVRVGDHVERPENRTIYSDRPVIPVNLSSPVTASTVNISIIGCSILQLCEVEVFAVQLPANFALKKPATQSSTFNGTDIYATPQLTYTASADLAVDGAPTKKYADKTCAVTDWLNGCTDNPWWQVDLGGLYDVFNVTIYQRGEGATNYGPLVVRVGDHVERPENRSSYNNRPVIPVPLSPPVTASTVNISIIGCNILQLCEVEVFSIRHVGDCASNPCQHGGSCTAGIYNYTCRCVPGYTGVNCETDINECEGSPCRNGATCQNLLNKFKCDCPAGYNGTTCEINVNECLSNPCQYGNCTDGVASYTCVCVPGYTGVHCETDINECGNSPCKNGATCQNLLNKFKCDCPAGYNGTTCEINIDECASTPCMHGGNCSDGINSYNCTCPPGYSGVHCQTDINECASSPCRNGSSCKDLLNKFECDCLPGYNGTTCEIDIDECASFHCKNAVNCSDGINNYTCTCLPGFTGTDCEIDIDECVCSPCKNAGHCSDAINSYTCMCLPDFTGAVCETGTQDSAPVIGGVLGGIAAVALIVIVVLVVVWMWRRQHPKAQSSSHENIGSRRMSQRNNKTFKEEEEGPAEEEEMEEEPHAGGNDGFYYNGPFLLPPTRMSPAELQKVVAACRVNTQHLKAQYERLPQGLQHPSEVGMNEHNKGKNRYKNICAYDHSRVVLSTLPGDPHSDYINACYVDGYKMPNAFIASQGPTVVNERDFIRMIWEKDIETIAMVTNPTEMGKVKCVQYWSDTEELKFGKFKVKVNSVKEKRDITIRHFTIKPSDGAAKQVTHFLYKAWPDKDVPDSPWSLIDFRDKVMTSHKGRSSPVLIHCSAGIGRTGTLIALDMALRQLEEEGVVDLFNIVLQIRQHRVGLVQTQSQYVFLHEAAQVGLCCADRVVPLQSLTSDPVARNEARAEVEFKALERGSTAFSAEDLSLATTEEALHANRDPDILPPNDNIVWLRDELEGYTNYINAVFVPSYTEEKRYIVTQTPLPSTVVNFWRAVLECNVKVIVTLDQTEPDPKARVGEYVPAGKTPVILGPLTLTSIWTERKQTYTAHCIEVTMGKEKPRRVQQFVVDHWPDSACVPSDPRQMISLAHAVLDCTPPQQGVILLHCRDGARRSGLVCGLLALLERCDSDREVAVPYVVGVLKSIRPQAVPTQEQYAFLYSAMLSHADSSMVYENVPRPKPDSGDADHSDNIYSN